MAGYQFGHIATFSLKGNKLNFGIEEIAAEAARLEGAHPHVDEPLPPIHLAGQFEPQEVPDEIRRRIAEAKANLKGRRSPEGKVLRIRADTHVMEAQVHSHPAYTRMPPEHHDGEERPCLEDPLWNDRYERWRYELLDWIAQDAKERGLEVLSIVEHRDESHPHVHAMLVPLQTEDNPRMDAKHTHPGHAAQMLAKSDALKRPSEEALDAEKDEVGREAERKQKPSRRGSDVGRRQPRKRRSAPRRAAPGPDAEQRKAINKVGALAYKAAMREWQTKLFDGLSVRHGLARIGPGRERVTRPVWKRKQTENEAVMISRENATTIQTVSDNYKDLALEAVELKRIASNEVRRLKGEAKALSDELVEAKELIERARQVEDHYASMQEETTALERKIASLASEAEAAEQKLKAAEGAEARQLAAEKETVEAEAKLNALRLETTALLERQGISVAERRQFEDDRKTLKTERDELKTVRNDVRSREQRILLKENHLKAKFDGLEAWALGRLRVEDAHLVLDDPEKESSELNKELGALKRVEEWLLPRLEKLEGAFQKRISQVKSDLIDVVKTTVSAWADGLVFRSSRFEEGIALNSKAPDEAHKLRGQISGHRDLAISIVKALPNLKLVRHVQALAEENKDMLTEAEARDVDNMNAMYRGLGSQERD